MKVVVVGGTNGLGRAIARKLAERGDDVTVVGRTFRDQGSKLRFLEADLSLMKEARRIGAALDPSLDLLVLTTGIFAGPERQTTSEGLERDMAVSFLNRLALLNPLAPKLKAGARVFVMGFPGSNQKRVSLDDLNSEREYAPMPVHMKTVIGNEALVIDAKTRWPALRFYGLNPGLIKTDIRANFLGAGSLKHRFTEFLIGLFTPSPDTYAGRMLPLLSDDTLAPGAMFNQKGKQLPASNTFDAAYARDFIQASEAILTKV